MSKLLKLFDVILLVLCIIFILFAFNKLPLELSFFIWSGVFLGIYYGKNNFEIYHNTPFKYHESALKFIAYIDAIWKHTVCCTIGSIALFLIANRTALFTNLDRANDTDLIVFLIAILGYTGLLPLTLTLFAAGGEALKDMLEKMLK